VTEPQGCWRHRTVVVPGLVVVVICVFLGTVGWYFLDVATAFNCSASQIDCGTAANVWLAAAGGGEMGDGRGSNRLDGRKPAAATMAPTRSAHLRDLDTGGRGPVLSRQPHGM